MWGRIWLRRVIENGKSMSSVDQVLVKELVETKVQIKLHQ